MNNKKIILVATGSRKFQFGPIIHLPLAILSIAAWLRKAGGFKGDIKIIDTRTDDIRASDFKWADIIGISAMTGIQIKVGLDVCEMVRATNPNAKIVWGGIHPSLLPEQTAMHPFVDCVVIGEGEITFSEVVQAISEDQPLEGIPGTCVRGKNGIILGEERRLLDIESLPLPAYDLVDMSKYAGIEKQFDYQSSRGCPFRCGFCYNTVFCNRRYRKKSAGKVIEELYMLKDRYGVKNFAFADDEFFIDKKRVEAIIDGIIERGKIGITASCRLDIVQRFPNELLKKIKSAGVFHMFFGAESGSDRILKMIKKDIKRSDIILGSQKVSEAGIRPFLSFMSGFPGEEISDFDQTLDTIVELWNLDSRITVNGIFPFNPYPGTYLYQKACDAGLKPPDNLEDWGNWTFQYQPDNPWLNKEMKQWMEIAFYIVRFKYYFVRLYDRYPNSWIYYLTTLFIWPLYLSAMIRIRKRWFHYALEWQLFALIARKTFGFL
jgi:anaerobic magnesium-protoporphyrin IX monomethyl ester cyclase